MLTLDSHAKLNLYLEVINKRKDNYHNINTVFEKISLSDKIILKSRVDKQIKIFSASKDIPKDSSNLAYRGAKLLQDELHINKGVEIKIIKRIPVGSGLGGGSSNAAYVLLGLNKLWRLNLTQNKLVGFAKKIGSDVPFFIYNCSYGLGRAKGDEIKPLNLLKNIRFWHILVVPKIMISTPLIYSKWDEYSRKPLDFKKPASKKIKEIFTALEGKNSGCSQKSKRGLTRPKYNANMFVSALIKKDITLINAGLFNGLEQITFRLYPELENIKAKLKSLGLQSVLMSGSGSAIFGISPSKKEVMSVYRRLKPKKSWHVYVAKTQQ